MYSSEPGTNRSEKTVRQEVCQNSAGYPSRAVSYFLVYGIVFDGVSEFRVEQEFMLHRNTGRLKGNWKKTVLKPSL